MKYFIELKKEIEIQKRDNIDFSPHLHERVEMGYIEEGCAVLNLDEQEYSLTKGDFFVVFPNQIHSYERSENIKAKIIIFAPSIISEYKNILSSKIPQNPVIRESDILKKIFELISDIDTGNANVIKGFLLSAFGILAGKTELIDINPYNVSTLKNLLIYCSEHFNEGITISDVAENLHISRYHIAHIFREKLNTTFSDYITQKRLEYAATLLCNENLNISDIAYQSGFNSLRSFNRNFSKYMNISPRDYKRQYNHNRL